MEARKSIVILDFGGQYAHLIASRVRRQGVFSQIMDADTPISALQDAAGIILSGGPQSVNDSDSPQADPAIFDLGIPVLGICYGLQWMTQALGGEVSQGKTKEYGHTEIALVGDGGALFTDVSASNLTVWMSHGDEASRLPEGFELIATSDACTNSAFADAERHFYAVQFHPEVTHTQFGNQILLNFVAQCDASPWSMESYSKQVAEEVKNEVGDRNVFMLVSGGVDSSVAFVLLNQVLGTDRVQGLLVDTGMMRKDEITYILEEFEKIGITNLRVEYASEEFFSNLKEVYEPEEKRASIGNTFLDVQKRVSEETNLSGDGWMLGQGTIYPDTIETGATKHSDKIKTHHNRVEAIQKMIDKGLVIEPLKDLYKDEVRALGEELGIPHDLVWRHPFPGPGLGVRILCAKEPFIVDDYTPDISVPWSLLPVKSVGVQGDGRTYRHALALHCSMADVGDLATRIPNSDPAISRVLLCTSHSTPQKIVFTPGYCTAKRANLLREADAIVHDQMMEAGLYESIWQFPVVLLPFGNTEGGQSVVLRPIESVDAMTANAVILSDAVLAKMTGRIRSLDGIDMVFLDLTNKPPGTIEWE
ncbi:MAG: glutamine-hydrolyzing GMP synthase [bacterium]|nr:glutamine-hydrolyzing GMP synthase [bacterium]